MSNEMDEGIAVAPTHGFIARDIRGHAATRATSDLLIEIRSEDIDAGLWEAADIQWWWATDKDETARTTTIWTGPDGRDVAYLILSSDPGTDGPGEMYADFGWLPGTDAVVRTSILPEILARIRTVEALPAARIVVMLDERDTDLARRLVDTGFHPDPANDYVGMQRLSDAPIRPATLPAGFRFSDEVERGDTGDHPLARRNGGGIAERLRACSCYRPDLDLRIVANDGAVVAYCLCWLDARNGIGLFEPVRTEDAFQRRGLGRALIAEGIVRLTARGATTIRLTRGADGDIAARLYRGAGFVDTVRKLQYVRQP